MVSVPGGSQNDWAWASDSDEISNGYSMVWSVGWPATNMYHSLAAFGCRLQTKDMYVHNTWWAPAAWWHYTDGERSPGRRSVRCIPPGASPHHMILQYPKGDTLYNHIGSGDIVWVGRDCRVGWDNGGAPSDSVNIDLSTDSGYGWQNIAHGVQDSGAYHWTPTGMPAIAEGEAPAEGVFRRRVRRRGRQYRRIPAGDDAAGAAATGAGQRPAADGPRRWCWSLTSMAYADSFDFKLYGGGETLFDVKTVALCCTVPTEPVPV